MLEMRRTYLHRQTNQAWRSAKIAGVQELSCWFIH